MPATAGRVRMPHNNVMTTSTSLKSSAVWQVRMRAVCAQGAP